MDVDVELGGLSELDARLAHARAGVLNLEAELGGQLLDDAPPMKLLDSPRMHARLWGAGDVWELPAGGWIAPRLLLPNDVEAQLERHVQDLLDGH